MNRTVRKVAITAAVTLVTSTMVAPAAVAHDRDGYRGGDRYGSRYDGHGDRDGYSRDGNSDRRRGDHDNYGGRDGSHRDRYEGRSAWRDRGRFEPRRRGSEAPGGPLSERDDADHVRPRPDRADEQAVRPGPEVAFEEQQRAYLAHLNRADAFLAALGDRIAGADLDPQVKANLLSIIAERRATIADLVHQVLAASKLEDLVAVRHDAAVSLAGGDDD